LGFVLARAHWGHGLGSEAAREVLRYAFETLALEQVTAETATRNFASLRILAKLGFKHIERFIDESDGEPCERFALDAGIGSSGAPARRPFVSTDPQNRSARRRR
jgi:ribosomal-protein-alanine N-acetyltransferase